MPPSGLGYGLPPIAKDHLPLELGDVYRVRDRLAVHVGQDVLQLGGVVGAELVEDERPLRREGDLRGLVRGLVRGRDFPDNKEENAVRLLREPSVGSGAVGH